MLFPACSELLRQPGTVPDGAGGEGTVSSSLLLHELWDTVASAVQEGCLLEEGISVRLLCMVPTAAWLRVSTAFQWVWACLQLCRVKGQGGGCEQARLHVSIACRGNRGTQATEISDLRAQNDAKDRNQLKVQPRCPSAAPSSPRRCMPAPRQDRPQPRAVLLP